MPQYRVNRGIALDRDKSEVQTVRKSGEGGNERWEGKPGATIFLK